MGRSGSKHGQDEEQLKRFVNGAIEQRLSDFNAWPSNLFKLELEEAGIYQNFSGGHMSDLLEEGVVSREYGGDYPYMVRPGDGPPAGGSTVRRETEKFYSLVGDDHNPSFSELALYTTLCRERKQLSSEIALSIYPKGEYPYRRYGNSDEIDALVELNREIFPIEIYNGINLVDKGHDKFDQLKKNTVTGTPPNNPTLVSRLSAENVRGFVRRRNGSVMDTGMLLGCTTTAPDLDSTLEFLNLSNQVEIIPPIETSDGYKLDGAKYDSWVTSHPSRLLCEKLESSATNIPEPYKRRVRGGLHLLYVITFYRRASNTTEREASMVLQSGFHVLMRGSEGMSAEGIVDAGWERFVDIYDNIDAAREREGAIRETAREYVFTLQDHNVISKRSGKLHARASDHPHTSLRYPEGYHRGI